MKLLPTNNRESSKTKWLRRLFNLAPAYRRTGGRVRFVSHDWKEVQVSLKLKLSTRNYVGTVFGGSIYGALDPIYMLQLLKILGDNYVVWDKEATVKFKRPIKKKVLARFLITDETLNDIKLQVKDKGEVVIDLPVEFIGADDKVYAEVIKVLYIADKEYYKEKRRNRTKS